jgi:hypothetical protein
VTQVNHTSHPTIKEIIMATKSSTKAAVLEDVAEEETAAEATAKSIINEAIGRVVEATGIDVQKNRYKAMRAIAFQAFSNAIADGTFDDLVDEAIANVDELPAGWEIERAEKAEPVAAKTKAPVKAKATTKAAPAKAAPIKARRPARAAR